MSLEKDNVIENVMKLLIAYGPEKFKDLMELIYNQAMQIERIQVLQAQPYERNEERLSYANGFKPKKFSTSLGKLDLQIPLYSPATLSISFPAKHSELCSKEIYEKRTG